MGGGGLHLAQNLRKCTLGAKLENQFFFSSKNDLHSPENDTKYCLKSGSELFWCK